MRKALILDLDGTVYIDGKPIENIIELLKKENSKNTLIIFLTNNTSVSKVEYVKKLRRLSLDFVNDENILSPVDAFLNHAKSNQIQSCYYLLPDDVINYIIQAEGPVLETDKPELVLIGFDRELTYQKLKKACELINSGIPYSITHIDLACPSAYGPIPDCGSITKLIESTTNSNWEMHFGKPSKMLGDIILKNLKIQDVDLENAFMVGDRYYTDIALGNSIGIKTCHVATGEKANLKNGDPDKFRPTFEYSDICTFINNEMT